MSQEITELDPQTVERIAAGEVVERPASAVKELLENSIDADASRVTVAVEEGGTESIRLTDDGIGMSETAVKRAVEEHTTSKIGDIDDLESGVGTLGFRGEALHAIGAVSRLTITTRPRGGDHGTKLTVEGGEITDVSPAGCPEGTTVEVTDLFYNVPARRKYLKQTSTEFAHINTVVTSYALANPDVSVTLEHNGRETFATNGTGNLRETVLSVYGREVAESMIDLDSEDGELPPGPLDEISGMVSHPETNRASRDYCSTFVNGRYVTANTVRDAVFEAYGSQLGPDRYPFGVLFLEIDPATVDVNVHPRKLEVRFATEEKIKEQIETAVEDALLREGLLRSSAPRGKSAPEQATISPDSSDSPVPESAGGLPQEAAESADPEPLEDEIPDSTDGFSVESTREDHSEDAEATESESVENESSTSPGTNAPRGSTGSAEFSVSTGAEESSPPKQYDSSDSNTQPNTPRSAENDRRSVRSGNQSAERSPTRKFGGGAEQTKLGEGDAEETPGFDSLPPMRVLGQLEETYIVAETEDGMVLIDQHAADERIHYERLRETFEGDTTTQALAEPVEVELTAREAELFDAHEDALATLGFHASLVDDRTVRITTIPSLIADAAGPELIRDVLGEFVTGKDAAGATIEATAEELLADLACYPSITGNTSLTDGSIIELLSTLDECTNPYACPHGRPVIVEFDTAELEARFERDYPGHAG